MSVPLLMDAPVVAMAAGQEAAGAGTMAATMGGVAPIVTTVLPPGADDASIAASVAHVARGVETAAVLEALSAIRGLFSATVGSNGAAMAAVDTIDTALLSI